MPAGLPVAGTQGGDNPILRASGHAWEADEKMKVDTWQDLINQEIKVAFAKARQSRDGPWSSGRALARP
ncbi:hypothetical protein J1605_001436 [Eschrichtius robustus]|uniref:Uncharacterized protein n=1 Tax=Eschrichtius robustus TaxID=9764 RepID=A0AB34HZU6_ESCRO|nr:hypothetical protein J1605_001436 [Eschrichtius robustus]